MEKEIIEKLEKLTSLDEYDVNSKYTSFPIDFEIKGNIVGVTWMNRDEGVGSTSMYDLSAADDVRSLEKSIDHVMDDLINEIKPEFLEKSISCNSNSEFYITEARFESKVRRENIFKISNYADLKEYLKKKPENPARKLQD